MQDVMIMIIAIVAIGTVSQMYRARLVARGLGVADREEVRRLAAQLEAVEQRLRNVESLVVERERHAEFDRALDD